MSTIVIIYSIKLGISMQKAKQDQSLYNQKVYSLKSGRECLILYFHLYLKLVILWKISANGIWCNFVYNKYSPCIVEYQRVIYY